MLSLFVLSCSIVNGQFRQKNFIIGAYDAPPLIVSDVTVTTGDYDGDGRAELSTKTNTGLKTGRWRVEYGTNSKDFTANSWSINTGLIYGDSKSRAVPADYDGDGKTDYSVSAINGDWLITYSSNSVTKIFKTANRPNAIPVPGDYDGNGCADIGYYEKGSWYFFPSANRTVTPTSTTVSVKGWKKVVSGFGAVGSHPVPSDYDGDGITDASVKIDGTATKAGEWMIRYSSSEDIKTFTLLSENLKSNLDIASGKPAAADYNGDGKTDLCVKTDAGKWYVLYSPTTNLSGNSAFTLIADEHGAGVEFIPVPANYETGDKKADIAIYDIKTGIFHIDFSSNGYGPWDFVTDEGKGGTISIRTIYIRRISGI